MPMNQSAGAGCPKNELVAGSLPLCNRTKLMVTLDDLNGRYGRGMLRFAAAGVEVDHQAWAMKQARRSPGYTTRWEDMPTVRM